jgi:D-alanyl-D-alanine carboxypeptidase
MSKQESSMFSIFRTALVTASLLVPLAEAQTPELDAALAAAREAVDAPGFSGAAVILQDGELIFSEFRGMADQSNGRENTDQTRFNIASIGKFLTAVGFVRAADQAGIADFAELRPAAILAEDADLFAPELTVRDLMAHGTSIESFYSTEEGEVRSLSAEGNQDIYAMVRDAQIGIIGRRNDGLAYNNSNAIVTGEMIARLTGSRYEDAMQALVFDPVGVQSARFTRQSEFGSLNLARPYVPEGFDPEQMRRPDPDAVLPTEYPVLVDTPINQVVSMAAGGLYITAADLAHIAAETMDGDLMASDQLQILCTSQVPMPGMIFGLGCGGRDFGGDHIRWGHNGGAPGVSAQLALYPNQGLVMVVLSNHNGRASPVLNAFESVLFPPVEGEQASGGFVIRN